MVNHTLRAALLAAACFAFTACGTGSKQQESSQIQVSIQPQAVSVTVAGRAMLRATVSGTTNTSIRFDLEDTNGGTVHPSGEYVAPNAPGTYRVRATSLADTSKSAVAVVNVSRYQDRVAASQPFPAARSHQKTAVLQDDSIVFIGGSTEAVHRYLPYEDRFEAVNATLPTRRYTHSVTTLSDGRVLVAGGETSPTASASAISAQPVLYEPFVGPFTLPPNPMVSGRRSHTATELNDGNVLLVGGQVNVGDIAVGTATVELYDRRAGVFLSKTPMPGIRYNHSATKLLDGRVLIVGGQVDCTEIVCERLNTALIYDPAANTFYPTGNLVQARSSHTATLLPDGRVFIAGGVKPGITTFFAQELDSFEIYEPASGTFTNGSLRMPRTFHTATLLNDGRVFLAGGAFDFPECTERTEIFDPVISSTIEGPALTNARMLHSAHLLPSGKVIVVGGVSNSAQALNSVDVFD